MSEEGDIHLEGLGNEQDKDTYLKIVKDSLKQSHNNSLIIDSEFPEEISEDSAIKTAIAESEAIANALYESDLKEAIAESEVIAESVTIADALFQRDLKKATTNSLNDSTTSLFEDPGYPSDESRGYPSDESLSEESLDSNEELIDPYYSFNRSPSNKSLGSNEEQIDPNYATTKSENLELSKKRRTPFLSKFKLSNLFKKRKKSNLNQHQVPQEIIVPSTKGQLSIIVEGVNEDESILKSSDQKEKKPLHYKLKNLATKQKAVPHKANLLKWKKKRKKTPKSFRRVKRSL